MPEHFFIIGAQRAGTSYLAQILDSHPAIEMAKPLRPEPKFFLGDAKEMRRDDYCARFFADLKLGVELLGEKSTSYLESTDACELIHSVFPQARILVMLRDPALP